MYSCIKYLCISIQTGNYIPFSGKGISINTVRTCWSELAQAERIGPSGVSALPLGARRKNVMAILNGIIFLLSLSESITCLPERRQVGF